ncbi:nitrate- and nitrite sensing domain-containing protein [Streptomyces chlorus]|uniref:histidine kinase n=1 Tax=Streptomyces chlorus TaxID=887452 RepID=A0ABW1E171_9ACTN
MRFRGKSIRRKIVALLLVPLVSLTAIWGFATVFTGRTVTQLFRVSAAVEDIGYPIEETVRVLQQERRQTLVHLADPRASDTLSALRTTRTATDGAIAKVHKNADNPDVRDGLSTGGEDRLTAVLDAFDGIDSLRASIEQGTMNRFEALNQYNLLVDSCYTLLTSLDGIDNVEMDQQGRALLNLSRAHELLSREDALLGSALVVGKLTRDETRDVSDLVAQRRLMYDISLPALPSTERERYEWFWENASTAPLRSAEQAVINSESDTPRSVTAKSWDTAADNVLAELGTLNYQATDRYQDRVRPVAMGVITQAVVAGLLGLIALLVSLFLSVRVGRGLIRDLRQLRLEAHEASGVRLPSVMRRLSAGEQVDVETEVPRLEYDRSEIGEVGRALNTLQRAAVEAAVKQSELRSGVSDVFVNLARRSQVLLHKQLTLLDTMERRTEDTEELADLFRLDHLTTRMRRHAEGLVILSGAAPSRQWRKPVQLMDVVRAAVAEVEDYERIEVRRLPRVAVTGPAVADLTHLVAELLENATVFSPPHTAVQVLGERVANGFTLEIHDRGLGMAAEALLDANLRLAETPEFELSDTDRLGLFVVSRLAQRQNVRVSLQPSPYGGTTAVVFIPDVLLTDDVPDTNGVGFRLDRPRRAKDREPEDSRRLALSQAPVQLPGLPASLLNGPVELEAPVDLDALDDYPGAPGDEDDEHGGLFGHRRSPSRTKDERPGRRHEPHPQATGIGKANDDGPGLDTDGPDLGMRGRAGAPVPPPRRGTPKLVSSHGRPVGDEHVRRERPDQDTGTSSARPEQEPAPMLPTRRRGGQPSPHREPGPPDEGKPPPLPARRRGAASRPRIGARADDRPAEQSAQGSARDDGPPAPAAGDPPGGSGHSTIAPAARQEHSAAEPGSGSAPQDTGAGPADTASLPRRVRQASLAPQLKRSAPRRNEERSQPVERDAEEVRSRMASLQRGWQRGREENAEGEGAPGGTAPRGTTRND